MPRRRAEISRTIRRSARRVQRLGPLTAMMFVSAVTYLGAGPLACSGEHDDLGLTDASSAAPSSAGSGGDGASGIASASSADSSSGTGAGPVGPTRLTVVNGVNDEDAIRVCALGHPDGEGAAAAPWPARPMPFAAAAEVDPIDDLVPPGVDVRLYVVAGDLDALQGRTCGELVGSSGGAGGAGGSAQVPGLSVTALPVLPAQVFSSGKHVLLVPAGCVGGPTKTDAADELACGNAYSPSSPTATLVALGMDDGAKAGKVALSAVHAAVAMPTVDVRLEIGNGGVSALLAPLLTAGAIGPKPPLTDLSLDQLGLVSDVQLALHSPGQTQLALATVPLTTALDHNGLSAADVHDGDSWVLVAVGSAPGLDAGPWWHELTFTAVRALP